MQAPSPIQIITRSIYLIVLLVAVVIGYGFIKKKQRLAAIVSELQSISSDSSFFKQFYATDARKTLIRAIGLIAEANSLGMSPDTAINRGLGVKENFYGNDEATDDAPARDAVVRDSLRGNYENFLKLGYSADARTIQALKQGDLPAIPDGPHAGKKPEIVALISPSISPGMEKVLANLELRPPQAGDGALTDIETASAKRLANSLAEAGVIEDPVKERIISELSKPDLKPDK
jgi:hypothetical protein